MLLLLLLLLLLLTGGGEGRGQLHVKIQGVPAKGGGRFSGTNVHMALGSLILFSFFWGGGRRMFLGHPGSFSGGGGKSRMTLSELAVGGACWEGEREREEGGGARDKSWVIVATFQAHTKKRVAKIFSKNTHTHTSKVEVRETVSPSSYSDLNSLDSTPT